MVNGQNLVKTHLHASCTTPETYTYRPLATDLYIAPDHRCNVQAGLNVQLVDGCPSVIARTFFSAPTTFCAT